MKINIRASDDFEFVELNFSDGHSCRLNLAEADKMKQGISKAINQAMTQGETDGGWPEGCENVESSDLVKEF